MIFLKLELPGNIWVFKGKCCERILYCRKCDICIHIRDFRKRFSLAPVKFKHGFNDNKPYPVRDPVGDFVLWIRDRDWYKRSGVYILRGRSQYSREANMVRSSLIFLLVPFSVIINFIYLSIYLSLYLRNGNKYNFGILLGHRLLLYLAGARSSTNYLGVRVRCL